MVMQLGTPADAAESATAAVALLLSQSRSRAKRNAATHAVDELATLFANAARDGTPAAAVGSSVAATNGDEVGAAVAGVYSEAQSALTQRAQELAAGDCRYAGASWEVLHQMGDRSSVPELPCRSLTQVRLRIDTARHPVVANLTVEQLHALQEELHRAVAAVDRVAKQ
uniref:COMM domain-containing protein n=1 Tax=Neobodo designis TaxID=312471 RepID=A0A7S1M1G6_NEODS|mmetsp:Transcript_32475/g.100484  ORF Transcript_32475/g.100484 Transcript_32475/m.100484 type:complete len:169 (+) Transcript_32475:38-544(+)|eukprot:CAMPEP_0174861136 /NCGR_PEP_ID=MMETSP1114-20130205/50899_1 /TAXON_ID=312471 /ORGANISM="Neobodo designis, Strain CCAP 1951/1" /LENGTH=168 /DNA_ID=CAMNT_0016096133 /DNA_START=35 /DNA_END=541 /DNA_ORIENTATION=+